MPASLLPLPEQILALLRERGVLSARDLQVATSMSQPSISLALAALGERICRIGAARSTRYVATKDILGLPATQALQLTDGTGCIVTFGELTYLANGGTYVQAATNASWLSEPKTLPWFLWTFRPQGFLARMLNVLRPDLQSNPEHWTIEQVLYLVAHHVKDPPGAFSLGPIVDRRVATAPLDLVERQTQYDKFAADIGKTLPASSSAGGEQPKFIVEIDCKSDGETNAGSGTYQHFIVKFSPPHGTPFGNLWRALLHLEKLARDILQQHDIAAATCSIVESGTRTYLQSQRFDRIGAAGKRHVVSIDALHHEFVGGARQNWIHTCEKLVAKKLLTLETLHTVVRIYAFGQYIGNTDMHFGNLSFFIDDVIKPTPLLAPVYDMLPMMWRPNIHSGTVDVTPVREQAQVVGYAREYADARAWAILFWQRAAQLEVMDDNMRQASRTSEARVKTLNFL